MQRRRVFLSLALIPLAPETSASTAFKVGILDILRARDSDFIKYLVPGMERLGYVEGKNVRYAFRHLDWDFSKIERFAEELVRQAPDVLVTESTLGVSAFMRNTSRIPIVAACADPIRSGFARSLSKPGGNVTGFSLNYPEIASKQVEFLKAVVPGLQHIAILAKDRVQNNLASETLKEVASTQGITTSALFFRERDDVLNGLRALKQRHVRAAIDLEVSPGILNDEEYAQLAIAAGVAIACGASENEKLLLGYYHEGSEVLKWYRSRWPYLIDRVLHGIPPGDLPFEVPDRYRLTINLRTAAALGLVIPEHMIVRADRIFR
jgi:putative ABC transport system substrate-binding protein